jgi:hypothetical protein
MSSRHMLAGGVTMALLIIKKHICTIRLKKVTFGQTTQKQGFIDTDIPSA